MSDFFLSLIIPMYNVEKYVVNTIKSIRSQVTRETELILVDDGSSDESSQVAEALLKPYGLSYVLLKQENAGQGEARNSGFREAHGRWILFLDSDDALQPYAIEELIKVARENPDADAIYSAYQRVDEQNIFASAPKGGVTQRLSHKEVIAGFLNRSLNLLVPGTLYRRDFLLEHNIWHRGIRWSEDQCFQWEVLNRANVVINNSAVLYNYLTRAGSTMFATPTEVMLIAYHVFQSISQEMVDQSTKKYMVPRWVLGCLHTIAMRHDKVGWRCVWEKMNGRKCMLTLLSFPDLKVKILALCGVVSSDALYFLLK